MTPTFSQLSARARRRHRWTHKRLAEALGLPWETYRSYLKTGSAGARQAPPVVMAALESVADLAVVYVQAGEIEIEVRWTGR